MGYTNFGTFEGYESWLLPTMRLILHKRIRHSKVLPTEWYTGSFNYSDLVGNQFIAPFIGVYLEDGGYEQIAFYGDKITLSDDNGEIGSWTVRNGKIYG